MFDGMIGNLSELSKSATDDYYINDDGFKVCNVCGKAVEREINFLGTRTVVNCICDCDVARLEVDKERKRLREIEMHREHCFKRYVSYRFSDDNTPNSEARKVAENYAKNYKQMLNENQGLIFYGGVGTGKTFYASCIANAIIDDGYTVMFENIITLTGDMPSFEGKEEYLQSLCRPSLLVIDDFGAERDTEYVQEKVYAIIDARYRSGKPFIITTNLSGGELSRTDEILFQRTYDRILERCYSVRLTGESRRRNMFAQKSEDFKTVLEG